MKALMTLILPLILISCASSQLPLEKRSLTFMKKTKLSKVQAYTNALTYISTNFKDSSKVIKVKSEKQGLITLKGNTACNIFRQSGDINDYSLQFTLTINTRNNKARLKYENLYISNNLGKPVGWAYNQLSTPEKVKESSQCLKPMSNSLFKSDNW